MAHPHAFGLDSRVTFSFVGRARFTEVMNDTAPGPGVATCPRCGTYGALPLHYGYPEPHHIRAALRGEIALGGVVYDPDPPAFECLSDECGYTFSP